MSRVTINCRLCDVQHQAPWTLRERALWRSYNSGYGKFGASSYAPIDRFRAPEHPEMNHPTKVRDTRIVAGDTPLQ
jgi:hypothetical protein